MPGPVRIVGLAALALWGCAREAAPVSSPPEAGEPAAPAAVETAAPAPSEAAAEAPPSTSPPASASAPPAAPAGSPVALEVGEPKFSAGDVPKAKGALDKLGPQLKACIDDAGGLMGSEGSVEVQLLVRAAGKAEGVDVIKAKGISDDAKKCIVTTLQKKTMGTPSTDPVGVTVVLKLTPAK